MHYYSNALERRPEDPGVSFKYAEVARQFNAYETALDYYKIALKKGDQKALPDIEYWMGMLEKAMGNYEAAKTYLENYQKSGSGLRYAKEAQEELDACNWALELLENPDPYKIERLNKRINTAYSEFGAFPSGDTIYYSSYRFENKADKHDPPRKITKVLYSVKGGKGRTMRRSFNDPEKHTAHTTFSLDKSRIYYTKCDFVNSTDIRCAIYYREKDRRGRWKKTAIKLPSTINKANYTATHPSIGFDSTLQKEVLFFVSDCPGGVGGLDIWKAVLDPEKKRFAKPEPFKAVNSAGNDITPFFSTITQTLYFSSDGRQTLGGYDVFKYQGDEQITHMGTPLNSSFNEVYFYTQADEKSGYFSSNRPGSFYLDASNKACCNDIYKFTYIEPIPETLTDSTEIVETPTPTEPEPPETTYQPEPLPQTLEDFLPLALYFDNDEPDKRTKRTSTKKSYEETYLRYYSNKGLYLKEFIKPLSEEDQAEAELELDAFFENEVKKGYDFLFRFSDILLEKLKAGEEVEIFIKGFTSPRANKDYNLALGKRRISSLRNHFNTYKSGIFLSYLDQKKLIITERSFGEAEAAKNVSDVLEDTRNSIYNPLAAKERRVEIVEIKRSDKKD